MSGYGYHGDVSKTSHALYFFCQYPYPVARINKTSVVDRAIFARAEATEYDGNASVASMGSGDTQTITAGQSGTVSTMNGGTQHVLSGGVGSALGTLVGEQQIGSGGTGYVEYLW